MSCFHLIGFRGVAMGVDIGIYIHKIRPSKLYGVKMTSERLFNSFIPPPPKKKKKILATPLIGLLPVLIHAEILTLKYYSYKKFYDCIVICL